MPRTSSLAAVLSLGLLTSCASLNFDAPDVEFGPQPKAQTLKAVAEEHLQAVMFDPESKRLRWLDAEPVRAAEWESHDFVGGVWNYGWALRFALNGKNRYGAYIGERAYYVLQRNGQFFVGDGRLEVDTRPAAPAR